MSTGSALETPTSNKPSFSKHRLSFLGACCGLRRQSWPDVIPHLLNSHRLLTKAHLQQEARPYFLCRSHNSGESLVARRAIRRRISQKLLWHQRARQMSCSS